MIEMSDEIKTTHVPNCYCPKCNERLDAVTSLNGYIPSSGDFTVCIKCTSVNIFTEDLMLRLPNAEEQKYIESDFRVQTAINFVKQFQHHRKAQRN